MKPTSKTPTDAKPLLMTIHGNVCRNHICQLQSLSYTSSLASIFSAGELFTYYYHCDSLNHSVANLHFDKIEEEKIRVRLVTSVKTCDKNATIKILSYIDENILIPIKSCGNLKMPSTEKCLGGFLSER